MVCLIFHTDIIINSKNWGITIKLHLKISVFFFKKSERTHMLRPPFLLFVAVRFSMIPPLLNKRTFWMTPSCFQNENYKWNNSYPTFFMTSFKIFWNNFTAVFLHFLHVMFRLTRFTFANLLKLVFHNSAWNSLT